MKLQSSEKILEGLELKEGANTSKYLLFRALEKAVPQFIERLMNEAYDIDFVMRNVDLEVCALDVKEDIDDYLGDVQYRVIDRLDEVTDVKRLERYFRMPIDQMVDKLNGIPVEEKVRLIIEKSCK